MAKRAVRFADDVHGGSVRGDGVGTGCAAAGINLPPVPHSQRASGRR